MYKGRGKIAAVCLNAAAFAAAAIIASMFFGGAALPVTDALSAIFSSPEEGAVFKEQREAEGRQVILSMGENPGTVYISWKGDKREPHFFRFAQEADGLPSAKIMTAAGKKILSGGYYRYSVELTGLIPGRNYFFEIGDGVVFDSPKNFEAPGSEKDIQLLYLGDVQYGQSDKGYLQWGNMTKRIIRENPGLDFAVTGGDMINIPLSEKQWNGFLNSCDVFSSLPLMTVPGNHEGVHSNKTYSKIFSAPDNGPAWERDGTNTGTFARGAFYWFDYGVCRFIMLDSSFFTEERRMTAGDELWLKQEKETERWLKSVLEDSGALWNIAVVHHPPYGVYEKEAVSKMMRDRWVPIMEKYGTDLVLCGHQHTYMRTCKINGIVYVMGNSGERKSRQSERGGAPFYIRKIYDEGSNYQIIRVSRRELRISSYNEKGLVIDEAVLGKKSWLHIFEFFGGN